MDDLRDAARLARDCPVMGQAVTLGRWAVAHLADGLSGPADPGLPAAEMIEEVARFGDDEQQHRAARKWLAVEAAAAALEERGQDEALSSVWESMPGAD